MEIHPNTINRGFPEFEIDSKLVRKFEIELQIFTEHRKISIKDCLFEYVVQTKKRKYNTILTKKSKSPHRIIYSIILSNKKLFVIFHNNFQHFLNNKITI